MYNKKKYKTTIYNKLLGSLIKSGKKQKVKKLLDDVLKKVSLELKLPIDLVLIRILCNLDCFIESKMIKVRKNSYVIPFPLSSKRQTFLKVKWILKSLEFENKNMSTVQILSSELINIFKNKNSQALIKRSENINNLMKNRSNIHFRW